VKIKEERGSTSSKNTPKTIEEKKEQLNIHENKENAEIPRNQKSQE
jgi:hypothetical protein